MKRLLASLIHAVGAALFTRRDRRAPSPENARRIVVTHFHYIGDVFFATPAIAALKRRFPDAAIDAVVHSRSCEVLLANPHLREIICFDRLCNDRTREPRTDWGALAALARRLSGCDLLVDFTGVPASCALAALARPRWSAGFSRAGFGFVFDRELRPVPEIPLVERYNAVAALAGAEAGAQMPAIHLEGDAVPGSAGILPASRGVGKDEALPKNRCLNGGAITGSGGFPTAGGSHHEDGAAVGKPPLPVGARTPLSKLSASDALATPSAGKMPALPGCDILLHVGAGFPLKLWPVEKFRAVAEHFRARGLRVVLVGGLGDPAEVTDLTIRQVASLARRCRVYVGLDTGLTHIVASLGVPTVAIYGPTNPRFLPRWPNERVVWTQLPCSAAENEQHCAAVRPMRCSHEHRCMSELGVERVVQEINECLVASSTSLPS